MEYFTEFRPNQEDIYSNIRGRLKAQQTVVPVTPEMLPSLVRAKTNYAFRKSISIPNSKKCDRCKKRVRADLVYCPLCGKRLIALPFWSAIDEDTVDQLNALQKEITFAPTGFKTKAFHPYSSIKSLQIVAKKRDISPNDESIILELLLQVEDENNTENYRIACSRCIELFILLNRACKSASSQNHSMGFSKHIDDFSKCSYERMTGIAFESHCAALLKGLGFANVKQTKASGDQGVDIIAEKSGIRYAIQCKCYSSPIGNSAIQEVYAGARYYNCDSSIVITNSTFTKSAIDLAKTCHVELWDGNELARKKEKIFLRNNEADKSLTLEPNSNIEIEKGRESKVEPISSKRIEQNRKERFGKRMILFLSVFIIISILLYGVWYFVWRIPNVEKFTIQESAIELYKNEQKQIYCKVLPEKASKRKIEWRSSDETIAKVTDAGLIIPQGQGMCYITATVDKKIATVEVCVSNLRTEESWILGRWEENYVLIDGINGEKRPFSQPITFNDNLTGYYYADNRKHDFIWSYEEKDDMCLYYAKDDSQFFLVLYYEPNTLVVGFESDTLYFYKR